MKIKSIDLKDYMLFDNLSLVFSPGINVISGENNTGKTALIKTIYSLIKAFADVKKQKNPVSKDELERIIVSKMVGVFKPENSSIGRLAIRQQGGSHADLALQVDKKSSISLGFSNKHVKNFGSFDFSLNEKIDAFTPIFIPPKEIISSAAEYISLYDGYELGIEETYYDLAKLLLKPLKKGPNTSEQNKILSSLLDIMNGDVVQKDNKFYLRVKGTGEFEMNLVSEGYRKLSTIEYLILSGSLDKNSILFWDEPESNMNPKMIHYVSEVMKALASMGVQIFITTHSYFFQQAFNIYASYNKDSNPIDISFYSLYRDNDNKVVVETGKNLSDIEHNAIMEEFEALYDREQRMMEW